MADEARAAAHWDAAYAQGDDTRSWFEEHPHMSLRMLGTAGVSATDAVIDVGGGASPLTRALLDRGFGDLTVLDISAAGMQYARDRLGPQAGQVHWLTADVLSWHPARRYQAWHDRAAFHFLTTEEHRQQYLRTLDAATAPGAVAVFGCFAPDGPHHCSGLPVARYSPAELARQLGAHWLMVSQDREEHLTPAGTIQPFTWIALRKQSRVPPGPRPALWDGGRNLGMRSELDSRFDGQALAKHHVLNPATDGNHNPAGTAWVSSPCAGDPCQPRRVKKCLHDVRDRLGREACRRFGRPRQLR